MACLAASIARFVIDLGVHPERIKIEGRAEYEPIESNNTPEGRAFNRRVDIYCTRTDQLPGPANPNE